MMNNKINYKNFEIVINGFDGDEKKLVKRISFPEAVRDAYMMIAASNHTKKIVSIRAID